MKTGDPTTTYRYQAYKVMVYLLDASKCMSVYDMFRMLRGNRYDPEKHTKEYMRHNMERTMKYLSSNGFINRLSFKRRSYDTPTSRQGNEFLFVLSSKGRLYVKVNRQLIEHTLNCKIPITSINMC